MYKNAKYSVELSYISLQWAQTKQIHIQYDERNSVIQILNTKNLELSHMCSSNSPAPHPRDFKRALFHQLSWRYESHVQFLVTDGDQNFCVQTWVITVTWRKLYETIVLLCASQFYIFTFGKASL